MKECDYYSTMLEIRCALLRASLMTGLHSGHAQIRGNFELGGFTDERIWTNAVKSWHPDRRTRQVMQVIAPDLLASGAWAGQTLMEFQQAWFDYLATLIKNKLTIITRLTFGKTKDGSRSIMHTYTLINRFS